MPEHHPKTKAVIAIDLGTSYSGFAFAYPDPRKPGAEARPYMRMKWPGAPERHYPKTLTSLLYTPDGEVAAWGFEARSRLARLRQEGQAVGYHLVGSFKTALRTGKPGRNGPLFDAEETGPRRQSPAVIDLLTDYLKHLKDYALQQMQGGLTGLLNPLRDVRWCLSVPAIWDDTEKQWMRLAAERAGLVAPGPEGKGRLCLVLEPEAAALYCQEWDTETRSSNLTPGRRFMVVDAGGGTVDITVHEVGDDGELKEVVHGDGGLYGSTFIDRAFWADLEYKLGKTALLQFHEKEPEACLQLKDEWEVAKCKYDPSEVALTRVEISPRLHRLLERDFAPILARLRERQEGDDTAFLFDQGTMEGFFAKALDGVEGEVRAMFQELADLARHEEQTGVREREGRPLCDYLFLVGGFAESPLLQQRIKNRFGGLVRKVIIPEGPGCAVLSGAVSYGLNPARIRARRSRLTYGCSILAEFDPAQDDPRKKVRQPETGKDRARDRFCAFVRAGDVVDEAPVVQTFTPFKSDYTSALFAFYATAQQDVRYTDETGVRQVGKLSVAMPDLSRGLDRELEVSMSFGGTEITVAARALPSGQPVTATLDFASAYFPEEIGG